MNHDLLMMIYPRIHLYPLGVWRLRTGVVAGVQHAGRGSAPSSPQLAASRSADSTPSKFNIFLKLKGKTGSSVKLTGKSSSKTDKPAKNPEGSTESNDGSFALGRCRSHDDIQSPSRPPDHDALYSPLHDRTRNQQNQDETRRTENTLKIWIMEAKGIPNKKKYYCILNLDSSQYGRTCSKQKLDMCFWGEYFELVPPPQVSTVCIELMREPDKRSASKRIGTVEIYLKPSSPGRTALEEQWYPVKGDKQEREVPALRIKHRFQSVDILPLPQYGSFRQYLKENSTSLCQLLEPVVSVKAKEDIATALINIMQAEKCAIPFLVNLVFTDIQRMAENEHLLFRGNSVATKAIEAYMKLVGEQYLHGTLREPVQALITAAEDLEVDPLRITNIQSLQAQRNALKQRVSAIWEKILQSGRNFPVELRNVFHTLRERLSHQEKCELTDNLISSCVFLRFLCPAVLSPSLFNITKEYPDERAGRNLTLVAKTLQTLANFTIFQGKENFMEFLNDFINKEQDRCRSFLRSISSTSTEEDSTLEFDGTIDLGKHLALLHLHLADALAKINTQGYESEASRVLALVDDISTLLGGDHNGAPLVSRQASTHALVCTPPLVSNPSLMATPTHISNNYMREDCVDGLVESPLRGGLIGGVTVGMGLPPTATLKSQSLPRAVTPVYSQHQMASGSPGPNFYRQKTAANDLSTNDEYVLITAFDHRTEPQNYMCPSIEANNNNTPLTDVRLSNGNTYYMAEVAPPESPLRQSGSPGLNHPGVLHQPIRGHLHASHQPRLHPRATTMSTRSHSLSGVTPVGERRGLYQDECSELYSYMDSCSHQIHALCMDSENNIQGSQTSISQLSNIASSGYQSFAYSQSSSPVDSLLHTDNSSLLSRENGNPGLPGLRQILHGSPLASPLHHPAASKHRAVAVHPAHLGYAGHVSLHGTPRHIPRVPPPKGSPNSSLSSSQSVEDLSSLRRGRTRQRRSASSSSDSSPDTRPASHSHAHSRRPHAHPPRTNPHCSPRLAPNPTLRQELRARSRNDRSISARRGRNNRSCDREDIPRGPTHCYEDSEDDVSVVTRSSGGAGVGSWVKDGRHISQEEYQLPLNIAPQNILDQQEDQMRIIVERLMSMEQEFRHEQEIMRREMHNKDARIDAQAKKIAALDSANTKLIRTIASLSSRSGEMKQELPGDTTIDSCNASDTSDYKSSSC
ncbi:disabled homolog 2-interacting protein isoform X1 [Procambarus clarkii]|uniref:disabled homolog 2-interacting protein isoform X1 n=2 Tax=Procambarus clarkii TaxID=6728 RepID=UPI0037448F48